MLRGDYHGEKLDWAGIFEQKRAMRLVQRNNKIYHKCQGCILLREDEWDDADYIDRLLLTHWINCNCKCIYCPAVSDEDLKANNKHYNIVPVLEDMCSKEILRKNAFISIAGGESTIYPEFEDMLHLLLDYGCDNILVNTSGIKFSPAIAKGLEECKLQLTISVDAGTKETYEKIKQVKTFEKITENLQKYSDAQITDKERLCSKFIIVPNVNDNKFEIENWLKLTKELGIRHSSIDVDWQWVQKNYSKLLRYGKIYDLILFAQKIAEQENLHIRFDERAAIIRKMFRNNKPIFGGIIRKLRG